MEGIFFNATSEGFVKHWSISGTRETPYSGEWLSESDLKIKGSGSEIIVPPSQFEIGTMSPLGLRWQYYQPGENIFVEKTKFYHYLTSLDFYAATEIWVEKHRFSTVRLWTTSTADIWCNGVYLRRVAAASRKPISQDVEVGLKEGKNEVFVRLQEVGVRDTPYLFGIRILNDVSHHRIRLPGNQALIRRVADSEQWINGIRLDGATGLQASSGPSVQASVLVEGEERAWEAGRESFSFERLRPGKLRVRLLVDDFEVGRNLEIASNCFLECPEKNPVEEHRTQYLRALQESDSGKYGQFPVKENERVRTLFRCFHKIPTEQDKNALREALLTIDLRPDCADFILGAVLRTYFLCGLETQELELFRRVVLNFRYWLDEEGYDSMCFWSENHELLFRGAQFLAGNIFPGEVFIRSGRTGAEQASLAKEQIIRWLDRIESEGYAEFLSSNYMPVTIAALANVADFGNDPDLTRRAQSLINVVFYQATRHCFDRVVASPQGRTYRLGVVHPHQQGMQALLSYATPEVAACYDYWLLFLITSRCTIPSDLEVVLGQEQNVTYRQSNVDITIKRTRGYMLSSAGIPSPYERGLSAGGSGYQQHLWNASLSGKCQVFVNHPGCSYDLSNLRPGYWYGNACLPATLQKENMLFQIYDISDNYPIAFTHAYWPSGDLEEQSLDVHWAFGHTLGGYIALWCDKELVQHDDLLLGNELRAYGRRVAWMCVCAETGEYRDFSAFQEAARALVPAYDLERNSLTTNGQVQLKF